MAIKGILRKLHHSQPQTEWFIKRVFTCRRLHLNKNIAEIFPLIIIPLLAIQITPGRITTSKLSNESRTVWTVSTN